MPTTSAAKDRIQGAGVMFLTKDGDILLLRRTDGYHKGSWDIPGGKLEDGEKAWDAAWREAKEEIGEVPPGQGGHKASQYEDEYVNYTTYFNVVDKSFVPKLNEEHDAWAWSSLRNPVGPLHPGVQAVVDELTKDKPAQDMTPEDWSGFVGGMLKFISEEVKEPEHAEDSGSLAMDQDTVRSTDTDGRMHVAITNISKANVCPYYGKEIPDGDTLGLESERKYMLYRDPGELQKAAASSNNVPLLSEHVPVSAEDHQPDLVIGSTGTDAEYIHPFLRNSLVVWAKPAIDAIEAEEQKELSCAYRYRVDMTPGTSPDGEPYDGIMRDIIFNHVALVSEGRAGPDVVVGDSAIKPLKEIIEMSAKPVVLSRFAAVAKGALLVTLQPKMAKDAKIDLNPILINITGKNFSERKAQLVAGLKTALEGKLAKDANLSDVTTMLDSLEKVEEMEEATGNGTMDADPKEFLKGKLSAEDMATYDAMCSAGKAADGVELKEENKAQDAEEDDEEKKKKAEDAEKEDKVDKKAMDAAIKIATDGVLKTQKDIREAERAVRPYVGDLAIAFDSAEAVYRQALKNLGVKGVENIHASALPTILGMQTVPGRGRTQQSELAVDSAPLDDFSARFPEAARISA